MISSQLLTKIIYLCALITTSDQTVGGWRECDSGGWVPYRENGNAAATYSFHACIKEAPIAPGWNSSHAACQMLNSTLLFWTHWRELAFLYYVFQNFNQTLNPAQYFPVLLNLRVSPYPESQPYITLRNQSGGGYYDNLWRYERETMIKIQFRKYPQPPEKESLDMNCAAFRMDKNNFIDSDIDFVPCDESRYNNTHGYDIQNDMKHFLCRKERALCPPITSLTFGARVNRIEGIQSYYYGTIRNRERIPSHNLLANRTVCHLGCGLIANATYYSGDLARYWCETGYRTESNKHSWEPNYAICNAEGQWGYTSCFQSPCTGIECLNSGVPYKSNDKCVCDCTEGWKGERCQERVINYPCQSSPCRNNGTCIGNSKAEKGYNCKCVGAMGDNCEFELNECSNNPCATGSLCIDLFKDFYCLCDPLKTGRGCQEVVPYCNRLIEPCKNGATCYSCSNEIYKSWCQRQNETQYICYCKAGFTGQDCSIRLEVKRDAWQVLSIVLGCTLFLVIALFCEIMGSKRRNDLDKLQILLETIKTYLENQIQKTKSKRPSILKSFLALLKMSQRSTKSKKTGSSTSVNLPQTKEPIQQEKALEEPITAQVGPIGLTNIKIIIDPTESTPANNKDIATTVNKARMLVRNHSDGSFKQAKSTITLEKIRLLNKALLLNPSLTKKLNLNGKKL